MAERKECGKCGAFKPTSAFHLRADRYGHKHRAHCKECCLEQQRALRKRSGAARVSRRKSWVEWKYGLTASDHTALRISQDAKCAICSTDLRGGRFEHIDHCHDTGRVRGILCSECNTGIGKLKDDPALLLRAVNYLTKP